MRSLLTLALLAGMSFSVVACNTVAGAGTDVSKAGSAVTDTSRKVQDKM